MAQASGLWRGSIGTRIRIASGLVLLAYVTVHLLNIGLVLVSPQVADQVQNTKGALIRSLPGSAILYGALAAHVIFSLGRLAMRTTLRMNVGEAAQTLMGLAIPFILATHIIYTRGAHEIVAVEDDISYIAVLIWDTSDGWLQAFLVLLVWGHGCLGVHFWLRGEPWWREWLPAVTGVVAFVPTFALTGFILEGRRMKAVFADEDARLDAMDDFNFPGPAEFQQLAQIDNRAFWLAITIFAAVAVSLILRRASRGIRAVEVNYVNGPKIASPKGPTLLEMSRAAGVPHTSLCGGRGRCTTCRVMVLEGAENLHVPSETEAASLSAVKAAPGARLACQIRPTAPITVDLVFQPDGRRDRAHASQGQERQLAILFLDMRGFTARTTGQLPYDIVFLLNRFFDAIVPAITKAGGTVDKYLGDGLLAVFETADTKSSARAALVAARGIGTALAGFNETLEREGAVPVKIGVGLHLGNIVLGEIGARNLAPRTIIGDAVNAASRLESETKGLGVEALVSQDLIEWAEAEIDTDAYRTLELRGVSEPVNALAVEFLTEMDTHIRVPTVKKAS